MYGLTYGTQPEPLYIDLPKGQPCQFCSIVSCFCYGLLINVANKEQIEGVDVHP